MIVWEPRVQGGMPLYSLEAHWEATANGPAEGQCKCQLRQ